MPLARTLKLCESVPWTYSETINFGDIARNIAWSARWLVGWGNAGEVVASVIGQHAKFYKSQKATLSPKVSLGMRPFHHAVWYIIRKEWNTDGTTVRTNRCACHTYLVLPGGMLDSVPSKAARIFIATRYLRCTVWMHRTDTCDGSVHIILPLLNMSSFPDDFAIASMTCLPRLGQVRTTHIPFTFSLTLILFLLLSLSLYLFFSFFFAGHLTNFLL